MQLQIFDLMTIPPGAATLSASDATLPQTMPHDRELVVGYLTGHIADVRGIDIWVNSENEDMIMDRFIGRSISANIRYFGADKDRRRNVREDTIANALKRALGGHLSVKVGTVIETRPGALEAFGVRRVYHVASVRGMGAGRGVVAALDDLKRCTTNVLAEAEERNRHWWRSYARKDNSIVFPLIGAGDGGLHAEQVAPELIGAALEFLRATPAPSLKEIYFLAFNGQQRRACVQVLEALCERGELLPPAYAFGQAEPGCSAEDAGCKMQVQNAAVP
jgi:O-acetyl-ADP-ribose deacetylase (regulator of RNase III)